MELHTTIGTLTAEFSNVERAAADIGIPADHLRLLMAAAYCGTLDATAAVAPPAHAPSPRS